MLCNKNKKKQMDLFRSISKNNACPPGYKKNGFKSVGDNLTDGFRV